jgi:hypothetical protein
MDIWVRFRGWERQYDTAGCDDCPTSAAFHFGRTKLFCGTKLSAPALFVKVRPIRAVGVVFPYGGIPSAFTIEIGKVDRLEEPAIPASFGGFTRFHVSPTFTG